MILPTKHVSQETSLLGLGGALLALLDEPRTVTGLWDRARRNHHFGTFARFVLALDLLYLVGAIDLDVGLVRRRAA
jgi:hypothetical protein